MKADMLSGQPCHGTTQNWDLLENETTEALFVIYLFLMGKTSMWVYQSLDKLTLGYICTRISIIVQLGKPGQASQHIHYRSYL